MNRVQRAGSADSGRGEPGMVRSGPVGVRAAQPYAHCQSDRPWPMAQRKRHKTGQSRGATGDRGGAAARPSGAWSGLGRPGCAAAETPTGMGGTVLTRRPRIDGPAARLRDGATSQPDLSGAAVRCERGGNAPADGRTSFGGAPGQRRYLGTTSRAALVLLGTPQSTTNARECFRTVQKRRETH